MTTRKLLALLVLFVGLVASTACSKPRSELGHMTTTLFLVSLAGTAKEGDADAQYAVGEKYSAGNDDISFPQKPQEAVKWYTLAAVQGHAKAQHALEKIYAEEWPGAGASKNYKKAVKWMIKTAKAGYDANTKCHLGLVVQRYNEGKFKEYESCYLPAIRGDLLAWLSLGLMYTKNRELILAYMWLERIAIRESAPTEEEEKQNRYIVQAASQLRSSILEQMTLSETEKAKTLSQRCEESGYKNKYCYVRGH